MKILHLYNKTMKTHFDKQVDKIRAMLDDKIADLKYNHNLFEDLTKFKLEEYEQ